MINDLKKELLRDEGFVAHAYQDHLGYWTIGIGRLIDQRRRGGLSRDEAEYLLVNDIEKIIATLKQKLPWFDNISDRRKRALVNMAFNLGVNGLLNFKKMLAAMADNDFDKAALEAADSRWYSQVTARAERVIEMIREG